MKRKNIFIIITISVLILAILLVYLLLESSSKINDKHISINFEIHNCSTVESNTELLRNEFIKSLLTHSVVTENNGLESLYLTKVSCDNISFSIPALGINSFRYKNGAASLKESLMTSISRKKDEESFFNNWGADGYSDLEKNLLKSTPYNKDNNRLANLAQIIKSESDEIIPDSIIIDKNCQTEQPPFLFSSTTNARKFIDEQLKKNKNAIHENGKTGHIDIFIWCGDGYNVNPEDRDNDGVINEFDKCPDEPGEKSNGGCPIKEDSDKDGVYDEDDACPAEKGEKACDGCPCPPPIVQPDDDKDGIPNSNDKCPSEFGFKRYNGCPIPDGDGDGINDELDKCPKEKGPRSSDGCPIANPKIKHNNYDGKFIIEGIKPAELSKYKINMVIYQSKTGFAKGANRVFPVNSIVFPSHDEANNIINALKDPVELEIVITISDLSGNKITTMTFSDLNMVCTPGGECGFKNLD